MAFSQIDRQDRAPWGMTDIAKAMVLVVLGAVAILIPTVIAISILNQPDSETETLLILAPSLPLEGLLMLVAIRYTRGKYRCSWSDIGFRPVERGSFWLPPLLVIIAWTIVVGYFVLVEAVGAGNLADQSQFPDDAFRSPVVIPLVGVCVIIAAPLAEETFFRGFLFRGMRNRWGLVGAALASGLLFGVVHILPILYIPFTLIGMLFAFGYVYSRSLWVPISAHFLFNGVSFIASVAMGTD